MHYFLYLIPISLVLGGLGVAVFFWTVRSHQYDDLKGAAQRILYDDDAPLPDDKNTTAPTPKDVSDDD